MTVRPFNAQFGAILVKQDQAKKLQNPALGTPDFSTTHQEYSQERHRSNNALIKGALRNKTGQADLHIGSCWGAENGCEPEPLSGYKDAIILNTRADAPAGKTRQLPLQQYNPNHSDEIALVESLQSAGVEFKRNSFKELYKEVYGYSISEYSNN